MPINKKHYKKPREKLEKKPKNTIYDNKYKGIMHKREISSVVPL
jgi:hypothetical protein